jgi:hypothetical protein
MVKRTTSYKIQQNFFETGLATNWNTTNIHSVHGGTQRRAIGTEDIQRSVLYRVLKGIIRQALEVPVPFEKNINGIWNALILPIDFEVTVVAVTDLHSD